MCQTMLVLYFRHYLFCIHVVILTLTRDVVDWLEISIFRRSILIRNRGLEADS